MQTAAPRRGVGSLGSFYCGTGMHALPGLHGYKLAYIIIYYDRPDGLYISIRPYIVTDVQLMIYMLDRYHMSSQFSPGPIVVKYICSYTGSRSFINDAS